MLWLDPCGGAGRTGRTLFWSAREHAEGNEALIVKELELTSGTGPVLRGEAAGSEELEAEQHHRLSVEPCQKAASSSCIPEHLWLEPATLRAEF